MFRPLIVTVTAFEKLAALTKKLAAETKSFKHKILGIKKLLTKIENYIYTYIRI